jgi:POLQ-like helicase
MHTEGLVIFSDPDAYDKRRREPWKFNSAIELLSADRAESTTSSLLALLAPLQTSDGKGLLKLSAEEICALLLAEEDTWMPWAEDLARKNPSFKIDAKAWVAELRNRRRMIFAVESHLMANRGSDKFEVFKASSEGLAAATLAHHLASDEVKPALQSLFGLIAEHIQQSAASPKTQAQYAKTLLGVRSAKAIENWVSDNRDLLLSLESNDDWLKIVWGLFELQSDDKFFHSVEPKTVGIQLASRWLRGVPYQALFKHAADMKATKPWGTKRRKLTDDDILDFCESTLGFQCSLVVSAIAQFLFGDNVMIDEDAAALTLFQKALKYGLPNSLPISCLELGFTDRVLAQRLCDVVQADGYAEVSFQPALTSHRATISAELATYPTYFESVLDGLV